MKRKRTRVPVLSILIMYFIFVKPPHNIETCSAFPGLQSNVKSMSWDFRDLLRKGSSSLMIVGSEHNEEANTV